MITMDHISLNSLVDFIISGSHLGQYLSFLNGLKDSVCLENPSSQAIHDCLVHVCDLNVVNKGSSQYYDHVMVPRIS